MTIGIKDVARRAGVSPATVSRVLGHGPVSAELRDRVEAAVRATGYRPNLSARRLRSQHSRTIGLIVSDIRNPFFTALSRAVEDAAYQSDMRVVLCNTDENPEREAMYLRLMQEERITGLIFAPTKATAERLDHTLLDFPVVLVDRAGPPGRHDCVVIDNPLACGALIEHLWEQGYRRIGGIFGNTSSTAVERHEGYRAAMAARGLEADVRFVAPNAEAAEAETARWLRTPGRPEALIGSNGQVLLGMVKALRNAGLGMPDDMGLAGFDNETWTELVGPGLTVVEQPVLDIGRTAMMMLFERLSVPDLQPRKVVLTGRLIVRGSTTRR
ncbi:LacI family DNA-binding transcriptional regulator [Siculibacillus lacustris]|uniref:LacI family DNA-binding transcriptional regulator n=1 Tax=Siculibacillus lacustris TaxID=1549641 RepID=A0A4V2KT22_9HYPH|nr:LacI family DNA-binding transcriptional regulator [Siculibacillus lacustris]TBW35386.1 LacI family DNA-binding transcriptional regulator [Siculibacillus lacustris]